MTGWHQLTAADEAAIQKLSAADKPEKEIARVLHIHRNTVYRVQKKLGLSKPYRGPRSPVLTKAQKRQVLRLLRRGMGTPRIAAKLGLREHAVRMFSEANRIKRRPGEYGYRLQLSDEKREQILQEIRLRSNFATDIAAKFDVPYRSVVRMAHEELNCPRFRSGRCVAPLSSDFPSKHFRGELHNG